MAVEELSSPPSLRSLYPRAVTGMLPLIGAGGRELPDTELVLRGVEIEREGLAAYDRVCGFRLRDEAPATYPHVLGFPLQMKIMTGGDFPFPAVGLVHIANRIEQQRALRAGERVSLRVRAADLREHEKGRQFDMLAEAHGEDGPVWRSKSTYLRRGGGSSGDGEERKERPEPPVPNAVWEVPGDVGRRYAGVSGDSNPIHMHALTARLFGMPSAIAHGMWLKARSLAQLEGALPPALAVEVAFKAPVVLPAKVDFADWAEGGARAFALHDHRTGKPHLSGHVESL